MINYIDPFGLSASDKMAKLANSLGVPSAPNFGAGFNSVVPPPLASQAPTSPNPKTGNPQSLSLSFGAKAALIVGVGFEIGATADTRGNISLYATGSIGIGVQTPSVKGSLNPVALIKSALNPSGAWAQGGAPATGVSGLTTVDVGAGVMATYDLNNTKSAIPSSGSIGGVGGGVWANGTATLRLPVKFPVPDIIKGVF